MYFCRNKWIVGDNRRKQRLLCDVPRSKCSGGLSSPASVEKEVAKVDTFITSSATEIVIAGTGNRTLLLSLLNWATRLSMPVNGSPVAGGMIDILVLEVRNFH